MKVLSLLVLPFARLLLGDARAQENPGIIHFPNRERPWIEFRPWRSRPGKTIQGSHWSWMRSSSGTTPLPRSARRARVGAYRALLGSREHLTLISHRTGSACLTQVIRVLPRHRDDDAASRVITALRASGYEVQGSYVPIHLLSSFNRCVWDRLPYAERVWADLVELPCEPSVSLTDVERIAAIVKNIAAML